MRDKAAVRKKRDDGESDAVQCPACDAPLKLGTGKARQKVQCPRCRATVEPVAGREDQELPTIVSISTADLDHRIQRQESYIRDLEARIGKLEESLQALAALPPPPAPTLESEPTQESGAVQAVEPTQEPEPALQSEPEREPEAKGDPDTKMHWLTGESFPDYSSMQAETLKSNLRAVPKKSAITVLFAAANSAAKARAEWFVNSLREAGANVCGPLETTERRLLGSDISMVTNLPVAPESAATFLAIQAAGFSLAAIYQTENDEAGDRLVFG